MWFATDEGLNRYDGKNIKQYFATKSDNSLPSNSVRSLVNTADQQLYVGTSKGLAKYQPEKDDFLQINNNNLPIGEIIDLQEGNNGQLLISTDNQGAFVYTIQTNKYVKLDFLNERIFGMTKDKEGFYWAFSRF
jgi:ligand-binding sensor domain-containing protein